MENINTQTPTDKQLSAILAINYNLGINFVPKTKEDARSFISDNIDESKHIAGVRQSVNEDQEIYNITEEYF